ncbi:MAG: DUF484 family protein [Alcaligenes aquatilis]
MDTPNSLSAVEVAQFLKANPDFFDAHADVFAKLMVPHPHQSRAISLGERQIMLLRERGKKTERQLATLVANARGNEKISRQLHQWNCQMLAESDPDALPALICSSLERIFEMPVVRLHCWNPDEVLADDALASWAHTLITPYCGARREQEFLADLQQDAQSVAIVPLKSPESNILFGLLVLGSPEATRFTVDMGTDFLEGIGELCSAALQRLHKPSSVNQSECPA